MSFGNYLIKLRNTESLRETAKAIGISHTYLYSLEQGYDSRNGNKRTPSVLTIYKIASYYNVSPYTLFDLSVGELKEQEVTT